MNYEDIEHYSTEEENRAGIEVEDVRLWQEKSFVVIERELEKLHKLSFLEAQMHCDNFHRIKREFPRMGLDYGFITAYVRQHLGTNDYTFRRRYLNGEKLSWYPIKKVRDNFNRQAFKRYSSHDEELDLALLTEDHFKRLRKQSNELKGVLRLIKRQVTRTLSRKVDKDDKGE